MKCERLGNVATISMHGPSERAWTIENAVYVVEYLEEICVAGSMEEAVEALRTIYEVCWG